MPSRTDRPSLDDFMIRGLTLARLGTTLGQRVRGQLEDLYGELMKELSGLDPTAIPSWKHARLQQLEKLVRPLIKDTYGTISGEIREDMQALAGSESNWVRRLLNRAAGTEIMDVALNERDLKVLAKDTLIQGAPSAEWWAGQAAETQDAFMREVRNGVMRGESVAEMARRIRGRPTGKRESWYTQKGEHRWLVDFEGGVLQTNTRNAQALVATSVMAIAGQSRRETYLANRDVIKGIEQVSTLDNRTTKVCMAYDGEKWEFEDDDTASSLTQAAREAHAKKGPKAPRAPVFEDTDPAEMEAAHGNGSDGWAASLEEDELDAISYYATNGYKTINASLRGTEGIYDPGTEEFVEGMVDRIDRAIDRSPGLPKDTYLYRGGNREVLGLEPGDSLGDHLNYLKNMQFSDDGFASTSYSVVQAEDWAKSDEHDTVFNIQAPAGTKGAWMPSVGKRIDTVYGAPPPPSMLSEGEFLLPRDLLYEVVDVDPDADEVTIRIIPWPKE